MVFHENVLFVVPFDHVLRVICFDELEDELKVKVGILPLYIPSKEFGGLLFKDLGSLSFDKPLKVLFEEMDQLINEDALSFVLQTKLSGMMVSQFFYGHDFTDLHILRLAAYSDLIHSCDRGSIRFWTGVMFECLKRFKPSNLSECTMLDEVSRFALLFKQDMNAARSFLLKIEQETISELGLAPYLGYRYADRVQDVPTILPGLQKVQPVGLPVMT